MANPNNTKDLTQGIPISAIAGDAIVHGRVGEEEIVVVKRGAGIVKLRRWLAQ